MHWNYRVITDGNHWWIGEVYYDEGGEPVGCTEGTGLLTDWDNYDEVHNSVLATVTALTKPVIEIVGTRICERQTKNGKL